MTSRPSRALSTPLFVPSFPATRANLDHYYVTLITGKPVAIGEAELVRQIAPDTWQGQVVRWGVNPITKKIDPEIVAGVSWMQIQGPHFTLVPKEAFRGKLPPSLRT